MRRRKKIEDEQFQKKNFIKDFNFSAMYAIITNHYKYQLLFFGNAQTVYCNFSLLRIM